MKKQTVVTVVYFLEESSSDEVHFLMDHLNKDLKDGESYMIVDIEDIEE